MCVILRTISSINLAVCLPSHKDASAVAIRLQFVVRGAGASTHRSEMPFWCLQTLGSQSLYYDC